MDIIEIYKSVLLESNIQFNEEISLISYDDSCLFCPAGMQKYKEQFKDLNYRDITIGNIQPCLRLNDLDEIGDGTHYLYFNMIGLFSFRQLTVKSTIDIFIKFMNRLNLTLNKVTIHPDKLEWSEYYKEYGLNVVVDNECYWSDGQIGGYCTEFYVNDIEVGNIVNTSDVSIDVGFGYERLNSLVNNLEPLTELDNLKLTILKLIESGIKPGNKRQEYVLRKLLTRFIQKNGYLEHPYYEQEKTRFINSINRYNRLKHKYKEASKEWWLDTHGVDLDVIKNLDNEV